MPDSIAGPMLTVPSREIPIPPHLSPGAQATLATPSAPNPVYPALDDPDAWRALVVSADHYIREGMSLFVSNHPTRIEQRNIAGLPFYIVTPENDNEGVILDFHGGGLIMGGGDLCGMMAQVTAGRLRAQVWAVDYRMPPDNPFPATLDDCVAAYRALLELYPPQKIILSGTSAGGNLAAATVLRARDEGLPLPGGVILITPEVDLTESGDSFSTNLGVDTALGRLMPINLLYAHGYDLTHPYVSPLFGDFSQGFPPVILTTGTRDLFLSNTVRMHRALRSAGIKAELHVMEAAGHIGLPGAPEQAAIDEELRRFMSEIWSADN